MKALQANPMTIGQVFQNHEFVIPEFQRPYSWGVDESEQLWDDISSFLDELIQDTNSNRERYFLGSIVVYKEGGNESEWMIIDGQQRLTTLLIITRLFFHRAGTHSVLKKMYYKTDQDTTDITEDLRLVSKVLAGDGRNDYEDLKKVINLDTENLRKDSNYKLSYDALAKKLDDWWEHTPLEQRDNALRYFRDNIVMLPIVCDSLDDALTLFQIINNRGKSLDDSDIFKAEIYRMARLSDREDFINRWNKLGEHETLFRIHMHTIRAEKGEADKEIGLRSYIQGYFNSLSTPEAEWDSIICCLEDYQSVSTYGAIQSGEFAHEEKILWSILSKYPNIYWRYPLYVFLKTHGKRENGNFTLLENDQQEYIDLLKNTVRYFFVKGVVYNAVNTVKDTTFKVCVGIAKTGSYVGIYRENIKETDLEEFSKKLSEGSYGKRYRNGLVLLCSFLNEKQNQDDFSKMIEKCQIEHILPLKWANYDKWDTESHTKHIDLIGNLIPLEWNLNIQAGNEFFGRKQERYKESKIQDALDLVEKEPAHWYPDDLMQRHKESLRRLNDFFEISA